MIDQFKKQPPASVIQDDTESSDMSYYSFDQQKNHKPLHQVQNNIQILQAQSSQFFSSYPQLKQHAFSLLRGQKTQQNPWFVLSKKFSNINKPQQILPSVSQLVTLVNLYRHKTLQQEFINMIILNEKNLRDEIQDQINYKKKHQLLIHERAQAKVRKQTGQLNYFSNCKRQQFQMRVEKAQQKQKSKHKQLRKSFNLKQKLKSARDLRKQKMSNTANKNTNIKHKTDKSKQIGLHKQKKQYKSNQTTKTKVLKKRQFQPQRKRKGMINNINIDKTKIKTNQHTEFYKTDIAKQIMQSVKKLDKQFAKKQILNSIVKYRKKARQETRTKQSQILQCGRCYPQQYKQMSLLYPNPLRRKTLKGQQDQQRKYQKLSQLARQFPCQQLLQRWKVLHYPNKKQL